MSDGTQNTHSREGQQRRRRRKQGRAEEAQREQERKRLGGRKERRNEEKPYAKSVLLGSQLFLTCRVKAVFPLGPSLPCVN